jgi:alkylhydroperoxidase family enzyme
VTEPRVPMLDPEDAAAAARDAGVLEAFADLSVFRVLLRNKPVARALADLLVTLLSAPALDGRLRELIIMRLGWTTGSEYEWTQHWRIALAAGLTEGELLGVRDWQVYDGFGQAERAVLAATDEIVEHGRIGDETWVLCERHLGSSDALVELVAAIGTWHMISNMLRSLEVPLEEGVAAWPPDGTGPPRSGPSGAPPDLPG